MQEVHRPGLVRSRRWSAVLPQFGLDPALGRFVAQYATYSAGGNGTKLLILLVPGERIELPTNGLQNRCSTAELTRQINNLATLVT